MTISPRVWNFPTFPISKQVFYAPGAAAEGGYTSGGVRMLSPEPGGFGTLEIQPSVQTGEWQYPLSSWLMSKTNGELLRVRLAPTPQIGIVPGVNVDGRPWGAENIYPDRPWANMQNWSGDLVAPANAVALNGTNVIYVDMSMIGTVLQIGKVIGHKTTTYIIDEIEYDENFVARMVIKPPLRDDMAIGDILPMRPYFTGYITNPADFRNTYDADQVGNIQLGKIILSEVILP